MNVLRLEPERMFSLHTPQFRDSQTTLHQYLDPPDMAPAAAKKTNQQELSACKFMTSLITAG